MRQHFVLGGGRKKDRSNVWRPKVETAMTFRRTSQKVRRTSHRGLVELQTPLRPAGGRDLQRENTRSSNMCHRVKKARWVRRMGRRTTQKIGYEQQQMWVKNPQDLQKRDLDHTIWLSSASKKYMCTSHLGHQLKSKV